MMKKGKCFAALLLTAVIAMAPVNAYGIETAGEYFEISSEEAGAFLYDGTTVMAGTDGEMILTKSESGWVRRATIRTTDMNVLTAEIVLNEEGLNTIRYHAKNAGKAQLIVVVPSGAAVNMGTFYVMDARGDGTRDGGWIQENDQWKYKKGDGSFLSSAWLMDKGKRYYFGEDGVMAVNQWLKGWFCWYYAGPDGAMMTNTVTPDGYELDDTGAYYDPTLSD